MPSAQEPLPLSPASLSNGHGGPLPAMDAPCPCDETDMQAIENDLFRQIHKLDGRFQVRNTANDLRITDNHVLGFLQQTPLYDMTQHRWVGIPSRPRGALPDMLKAYHQIIEAVINFTPNCAGRRVYSSPAPFSSRGPNKSSPVLAITGTGPWFHPLAPHGSFHSMISPLEVKLDKDLAHLQDMCQLGLFARECFWRQANRVFVNSLILTENQAIAVRFTRGGAFHYEGVNIHTDPVFFVYLLVEFCNPHSMNKIGFNSQIVWRNGLRRYIERPNAKKDVLEVLEVIGQEPVYHPKKLTGRVSCCWNAKTNRGEILFVKYSWRFCVEDYIPEGQVLLSINSAGIEGVSQMVHGMEMMKLPARFPDKHEDFDRAFSCITLKLYNRSILQFANRKELLMVFKDVISAHCAVFGNGILHRDISPDNIMIADSPSPKRGVLVDFNKATVVNLERNQYPRGDYFIVHPTFQSIAVLETPSQTCFNIHIHDLECFFYVLLWICASYKGPNVPIPSGTRPAPLTIWETRYHETVATSKREFLSTRIPMEGFVTPYFGGVFLTLLETLRIFFAEKVQVWTAGIRRKRDEADLTRLAASAWVQDYHYILGVVDAAIQGLAYEERSQRGPR